MSTIYLFPFVGSCECFGAPSLKVGGSYSAWERPGVSSHKNRITTLTLLSQLFCQNFGVWGRIPWFGSQTKRERKQFSFEERNEFSPKRFSFGGLRKYSGCITNLNHSGYLPDHQVSCDSRSTKRMGVVIIFLQQETAGLLPSWVWATDFHRQEVSQVLTLGTRVRYGLDNGRKSFSHNFGIPRQDITKTHFHFKGLFYLLYLRFTYHDLSLFIDIIRISGGYLSSIILVFLAYAEIWASWFVNKFQHQIIENSFRQINMISSLTICWKVMFFQIDHILMCM